MSDYFVIRCSEDGDISVDKLDEDTLTKRLDEGYYGEGDRTPRWAKSPPDRDPQSWGYLALIIKGEAVIPRAVDVVKRWEVP